MTLITIRAIQRKSPMRGTTCIHGRSQSPWLVKLENDVPAKPWRRVYEDWNQLEKNGNEHDPKKWSPVPLVLVIGTAIITLDADQRAQLENYTTNIGYQIVDARKRGDDCYRNKRGWYWHELDRDAGIDTATITGPYKTEDEAREACLSCPRHQNGEWRLFA